MNGNIGRDSSSDPREETPCLLRHRVRLSARSPPTYAASRTIPVSPRSETGDTIEIHETIDSSGDLILRVGSTSYLVCSKALASASPVFKTALFGPCEEPRPPSDPWVAGPLEDGNDEMVLFLQICHGLSVPPTLSGADFVRLLSLLGKYAAVEVIQPWVGSWIKHLVDQPDKSLLPWIAWKLGDSRLLRDSLLSLAEGREADGDNGKLVIDEECAKIISLFKKPFFRRSYTSEDLTQAKVLRAMLDARKAMVEAEIRPFWGLIKELERVEVLQEACVAGIFGKVFVGLKACGVKITEGFEGASMRYEGTVKSLRDAIEKRMALENLQHCDRCTFWLEKNFPENDRNIHVQGFLFTESRQDSLGFGLPRTKITTLAWVGDDLWSRWEGA
ncbi:nuclear pore protein-like protein [Colletotrichum plurivorum]|uniref:Nuclear pore protein-like protein n=1 Tax=Colletotrichum plurivorum TaxID=2175906 RepID=A0A8H6NJ17_9PEZI|nr:nuclear pore protein-like protein [Colletotrichum plurivorum]